MIAIAHFAGLVLTTIFAAAAAVLLDWLLLRAMFQLMRPATAAKPKPTFGVELVQRTRELERHLGPAAVRRQLRISPARSAGARGNLHAEGSRKRKGRFTRRSL